MAFIAKNILHAGVVDDFYADLARAGGPGISESAARGANAILTQVKGTATPSPKVEDLAQARRAAVIAAVEKKERGEGALLKELSASPRKVSGVVSELPGATRVISPTADVPEQVAAEWGFNPAEAFQALNEWGVVYDKRTFTLLSRQLSDKTLLTNDFVRVSQEGNPLRSPFVVQSLLTRFEEEAGNIAKTVAAVTPPDNAWITAKDLLWKYLRLWRVSVIMGAALPRAAFFANQAVGDFSQLMVTEGLINIRRVQLGKDKGKRYATGALPLMFRNAFTYVPYFGNHMQDYLSTMGKNAPGVRAHLTSPINAAFDPTLTQVLKGGDELVETREGLRSLDQILADMVEDGVLDSMMTDDLYNLTRKLADESVSSLSARVDEMLTKGQNWGRHWQDLATTVQIRQRAALYLEYRLMRGESRTASKAATHDAFFDWKFGVTEAEMKTLGKFIAFYPFFRLAMKQTHSSVLEGLTKPSMETFTRAMTGRTRLGRTRAQAQMLNTFPDYVFAEGNEDALSRQETVDYLLKNTKAWYLGTRPVLTNDVAPESEVAWHAERGRTVTHVSTVLPMWTAIDMLEMYRTVFEGLGGLMLEVASGGQIRTTYDAQEKISQRSLDHFLPVAKGLASGFLGGKTYENAMGKRLRLSEQDVVALYSKFPFIGSAIQITEDGKGAYIEGWKLDMLRSLPVIGTEIPQWYGAIYGANPEWQNGVGAGFGFMTKQLTGVLKKVPFDATQAERYKRLDIQASFKKKERQLRSQAEGPARMQFPQDED
jgi:hypothetical protein